MGVYELLFSALVLCLQGISADCGISVFEIAFSDVISPDLQNLHDLAQSRAIFPSGGSLFGWALLGTYLTSPTVQPASCGECGDGGSYLRGEYRVRPTCPTGAGTLLAARNGDLPGRWTGFNRTGNSSFARPSGHSVTDGVSGLTRPPASGDGEVVQGVIPAISVGSGDDLLNRAPYLALYPSSTTAVPQEGAPHESGDSIDGNEMLDYLFITSVIIITIYVGVRCTSLLNQYVFWVATFHLISTVSAVCPGCFGNIQSCEYDTKGTCPTIETTITNANLVAGLTTVTATALTLTNVISTRFLRMFTRAHLQLVLQLVRRPAPGTVFELAKDTKVSAILQAVAGGMITLEQAAVTYMGFIDDAADDTEREALTNKFKLLTATKDLKGFSGSSATVTDTGVYSWLWGRVTNFVADRGMHVKIDLEVSEASSSAANVLSSNIRRSKDFVDVAESLNIWILYVTALGLCTAVVATEFIELTVYDTIRMRGYPWQVAHEVFVIMLRRIEDSGGTLTLVNCVRESVLNTVLDEAAVSAKRHYGGAAFFRHVAEGVRGQGGKDDEGKPFNGKWTASAKEPCWHFNIGKPHPKEALHPDGTCKRVHACDHYVSNKGAGGRCMSLKHSRADCDNPHKCDAKVQ